ncbi:MAG: hypothetical protein JRI94_00360 [Deltaproteobacteria bacterium]|nr:hypothetical protein [Deltaproteobacteria bacterium]
MSILKETWLRWPVSTSPDVVNHKMYYEEAPGLVVTDPANPSPSVEIGNTIVTYNDTLHGEVNLAEIPGMTTLDGRYNIGVACVDDRGNEASPTLLDNVPLDFEAPDPVGALVISDS